MSGPIKQHQRGASTIRLLPALAALVVFVGACASGTTEDTGVGLAAVDSSGDTATPAFEASTSEDSTPEESASDGSYSGGSGLDPVEELGWVESWHWQLDGEINSTVDVDLYDIDLFDTSAEQIAQLHTDGRVVMCYFSAGSYEDWRDDAAQFPEAALGNALDGWEGERWVDIRSPEIRAIMSTRFDIAAAKGCDGTAPDNVSAYDNDPGFDFTADDQLDFNRFLASESHTRGLLIGLKNNLEQIPALVDDFDYALNEQCFEYDECDAYLPFLTAGKLVLTAEYANEFVDDATSVCSRAEALGIVTLVLPLDLDDSFRIAC